MFEIIILALGVLICILFVPVFSRKVKEAWENKKDVLVKSGAFAIEQLSEALSCSSTSDKLPDGVPASALRLCSEQVRLCASAFVYYFNFARKFSLHFLDTQNGYKENEKGVFSFSVYDGTG